MKTLNINKMLISVFVLVLSSTCSLADEFHYINSNVGDRASGMAGAYTAVSDDSAGCYYNPAGLALAPGNKFSASVNAINTSTKTYKGIFTGVSGEKMDWDQESFSLMPNYFGIIQKFGPGMVGFSYASPDSFDRQQEQSFSNIASGSIGTISRYTINMNDFDKVYLFGPSYAQSINSSLSFGATLYYYYRDTQIITNQFIEAANGDEYIINNYQTKTEYGLQPIIGVLWEPVDTIALGLSFSKRLITDSDSEIQTIANSGADFTLTPWTSKEKAKMPLVTSLGVAWFYSPSFLLSADLKYFEKIDGKEDVLNVAIGTEYYINDSIALRCGAYTDIANTQEIPSSLQPGDNYDENFDIYGTSGSITFFSKKSSITLGFVYSFGSGESQPFNNTSVYDVEYNNLSINLSTSFNY